MPHWLPALGSSRGVQRLSPGRGQPKDPDTTPARLNTDVCYENTLGERGRGKRLATKPVTRQQCFYGSSEKMKFLKVGGEKKVSVIFSPPSRDSGFSREAENAPLACLASCDAASARRDSPHPSPAEPAAPDKICLLSWRRYYTKTTSPELLGKLLQVMQVANNSRGFHSSQG